LVQRGRVHQAVSRFGEQRRGGGVGADLGDVFAARDDGRDGGVAQAPGESPLRHRHAGGDLGGGDFFHLGEQGVATVFHPDFAHVVGGEDVAGLVAAGEEAAGERHTGEDAEILALA
jgi:hypothetical protein